MIVITPEKVVYPEFGTTLVGWRTSEISISPDELLKYITRHPDNLQKLERYLVHLCCTKIPKRKQLENQKNN